MKKFDPLTQSLVEEPAIYPAVRLLLEDMKPLLEVIELPRNINETIRVLDLIMTEYNKE